MATPAGCRTVLESLPNVAALLDGEGDIVAVNSAWTAFGRANGQPPDYDPVGENYLAVTRRAEEPSARRTAAALAGVLDGLSSDCSVEYPCHGPEQARWFQCHASGVADDDHVLVVHRNVTTRRLVAAAPPTYRDRLVSRLREDDEGPQEAPVAMSDDAGRVDCHRASSSDPDAGGYLVRYSTDDDSLVAALVGAFGALGVDVDRQETVLGDWIEPSLLTALDERDDPFAFTTRVWGFEVCITEAAVTLRDPAQRDDSG